MQATVRVGNLPQQSDDAGFFLLIEILVKKLREFVERHKIVCFLIRRIHKFGRLVRRQLEMSRHEFQDLVELIYIECMV